MKGVIEVELNEKQQKCIQLLAYTNKSKTAIAKELEVNPNTITTWFAKEEFTEALHKEIIRRFGFISAKAVNRLDKLIDSKNDMVALNACKEVLSKSGFDAVQKIEANVDNVISVNIGD